MAGFRDHTYDRNVSAESSKKAPVRSKADSEAQSLKYGPWCGMWKDREDMKDPVAYIRNMRGPRYTWDDKLGVVRTKPLPGFIKS